MPKFLNILNQKKPGVATLVAITIVMFTSLLVGLAVSQRAGSGIRRSTYTGQTDQAFSCTTSGVEDALLCITNTEKANQDPTTSCAKNSQSIGSCSYSYTVANLTDNEVVIDLLEKDSVQQFDVSTKKKVTVDWGLNDTGDLNPGIEVSYIYKNGPNYEMKKYAYVCSLDSTKNHGSMQGFDTATPNAGKCSKDIINLATGYPQSIIRIRPYFSNINLKVTGLGGNKQGYLIKSSGTAGNVTRNVEVLRMSPQLPAIFDYVLYSEEGSINK